MSVGTDLVVGSSSSSRGYTRGKRVDGLAVCIQLGRVAGSGDGYDGVAVEPGYVGHGGGGGSGSGGCRFADARWTREKLAFWERKV